MQRAFQTISRLPFWLQSLAFLCAGLAATVLFIGGAWLAARGKYDVLFVYKHVVLQTASDRRFATENTVFHFLIGLILSVWQVFLLLYLLTNSRQFRFSKNIALYQSYSETLSEGPQDFVVFSLVNQGQSPLLDVTIAASLAVYQAEWDGVDYYTCELVNDKIPVMGHRLPFRIFIKTGEIHFKSAATGFSKLLFLPAETASEREGAPILSLASGMARGDKPARFPICQLHLFVRGYDPQLDKSKAAHKTYDFFKLVSGRFENIAFEPDAFRAGRLSITPAELAKFDNILPR